MKTDSLRTGYADECLGQDMLACMVLHMVESTSPIDDGRNSLGSQVPFPKYAVLRHLRAVPGHL